MKKDITTYACIVAGMLLGLTGCKRAIEEYLKDNPTAEYGFCQLRQFNFRTSGTIGTQRGVEDTVVFTYNAHGDPVTGLRAKVSTGYPNFFFRYDRYDRLTDLIGGYGTDPTDPEFGGVEIWNRFKYDNKGNIVLDSMYTFPAVVDGHPAFSTEFPSGIIIKTYQYDSKDRIKRSTYGSSPLSFSVANYSYDAHGNLVGTPHDNKINFHRTNKIWMFLDADYSVNNPLTAAYTYNDHELPVNIVPTSGTGMNFMDLGWTSLEYDRASVRYSCK